MITKILVLEEGVIKNIKNEERERERESESIFVLFFLHEDQK